MSLTDLDYIRFNPFQGEEGELTLQRVVIRRARKPHECFLGNAFGATPHQIQPGERYREERALVDGDYFGRYCMCLPCIDKELAEPEGDDE